MKISTRGRVGHLRYSLVIRTVKNIQGITSSLGDGNHILMWDFDNAPLTGVIAYLAEAQDRHGLPAIHIALSSTGGGFHAYCLFSTTWLESLHIVSGTKGVDPDYVSMAAWRQRWTLRLSDKGSGVPRWVYTLKSEFAETVTPLALSSWVDYEIWTGKKAATPRTEWTGDGTKNRFIPYGNKRDKK